MVGCGSPSGPPACASVIFIIRVALSLIILSNTLHTLLASVMPLSLEHLPLVPFPLYSPFMFPLSHWSGMLSSLRILLNIHS